MKSRFVLAAVIALGAAAFSGGTASAIPTGLPAGVATAADVEQVQYRPRHRHWRPHRRVCRVVVRRHINRFGERVTVRRRICR
jgi:hypothetical protein